jgi:hypothetical protein
LYKYFIYIIIFQFYKKPTKNQQKTNKKPTKNQEKTNKKPTKNQQKIKG